MTFACELDHLVVVAPSLARGVEYVADSIGVEPGAGGAHPRMGTHNRLLRLGEGAFLEVIAVDPTAPAPARPRWFGLDELGPDDEPRLAAWVARTTDLRGLAGTATELLGEVETMTRGEREWLIAIRADGRPPKGGALPALIEWTAPARSAAFGLEDRGCALARFTIEHPSAAGVSRALEGLGLVDPPRIVPAARFALIAEVSTPRGLRHLA